MSQELIDDAFDAPSGPQVGAFFDFDKTIISGYSATSFLKDELYRGDMTLAQFAGYTTAIYGFVTGRVSFTSFMTATSRFLKGVSEAEFERMGRRIHEKYIAGAIYPEARELIKAHLAKGHTVAIVSSATPYQILPAAEDLDVPHILCTLLEVEEGAFTGNVISPTCFGEGKRLAAENLAADYGIDLDQSFFYTDSDDDLPLLEAVGHPRVLNPNKDLNQIALRRGWPVHRFDSRGRPGISDLLRTGLAYATMPTAVTLGLPIWWLTGRKRDALNTSFRLWADYASALTGLTVEVEGEEHLYEHRPAVFIFNHQSSSDVLILVKLLQKDFTGVGKKEIADFPVLGQIFKFADVVFIDRKNTPKAIEAMKPAVDALQKDGLSIVLAPEGTRSRSIKLGKFKKGAFHLAHQAKVPIVPIVIHNAIDALPKGQNILRPAHVKVTVLPPVDTSQWRASTMEQHVADVRSQFLTALGQDEDDLLLEAMPSTASEDKENA